MTHHLHHAQWPIPLTPSCTSHLHFMFPFASPSATPVSRRCRRFRGGIELIGIELACAADCSASARISGVCYTCHVLYNNGRESAPSHHVRHEQQKEFGAENGNDKKGREMQCMCECRMKRDRETERMSREGKHSSRVQRPELEGKITIECT